MWRLEQVHHVPGTIISLPKTGDLSDASNYRGITLLSVLYKLYTSVLNQRLIKFAEGQQLEQQQQQETTQQRQQQQQQQQQETTQQRQQQQSEAQRQQQQQQQQQHQQQQQQLRQQQEAQQQHAAPPTQPQQQQQPPCYQEQQQTHTYAPNNRNWAQSVLHVVSQFFRAQLPVGSIPQLLPTCYRATKLKVVNFLRGCARAFTAIFQRASPMQPNRTEAGVYTMMQKLAYKAWLTYQAATNRGCHIHPAYRQYRLRDRNSKPHRCRA
jgi:flagellar motor protein MotB